tara:strand:- start:1808 stop:2149 length:342 start_codon:yes stop_codon:yes gene_type:complete
MFTQRFFRFERFCFTADDQSLAYPTAPSSAAVFQRNSILGRCRKNRLTGFGAKTITVRKRNLISHSLPQRLPLDFADSGQLNFLISMHSTLKQSFPIQSLPMAFPRIDTLLPD